MFSPLVRIFGTWIALVGMCQAGNLERSGFSPLSIVYTLYPYYNSETLLGVLKADDESLGLSAGNVVPLIEAQRTRNTEINVGPPHRDESVIDSNDRDNDDSSESTRQRIAEQPTEITYWPPVQRGATPKPHLGGATGLGRQTDAKK